MCDFVLLILVDASVSFKFLMHKARENRNRKE